MNDETEVEEEETVSAPYLIFFSLLISVTVLMAKVLHDHPIVLPEAGMVILLGALVGMLATAAARGSEVQEALTSFSPDVFFSVLLPPIIFNSGYHIRRVLFLRHLLPILLFAALGTAVASLVTGLLLYIAVQLLGFAEFVPTMWELLAFGALISSTDPVSTLAIFQAKRVDPQLFYLVFGESALNDAVGLLLFTNFANMVTHSDDTTDPTKTLVKFFLRLAWDVVGSPLFGIMFALGLAFLLKHFDMRHNVVLELSLYVFVMIVPYLVAEELGLSGIVTILFAGMASRAFVVPNLSHVTAVNADLIFRLVAFLSEQVMFLQMGLSMTGFGWDEVHPLFISCALVACLVARALNVYPATFLNNYSIRRQHGDLSWDEEQIILQISSRSLKKTLDNIEEQEQDPLLPKKEAVAEYSGKNNNTNCNNSKIKSKKKISKNVAIASTNSSGTRQFYRSICTPEERGDLKILPNVAHMIWFSGLRGVVSYACAQKFPDDNGNRGAFVGTTVMIVLITLFTMGTATEKMLQVLNIETDVDEEAYMESWKGYDRNMPRAVLQFEELVHKYVTREEQDESVGGGPETYCTAYIHSISHSHDSSNLDSHDDTRVSFQLSEANSSTSRSRRRTAGIYDFGQD